MKEETRIIHQERSEQVETLLLDTPQAIVELSLFGAQVLSFIPKHDGRERLWLSEQALWDGSKSIRGGIPVCWPWFGAHTESHLPAHGYVRSRRWELVEYIDDEFGTELALQPISSQGEGFDGEAAVELRLGIADSLTLQLTTLNQGNTPFLLNCALHSYFHVADILQTELSGLSGEYSDKLQNWSRHQTPAPYHFREATDRIHLQAAEDLNIHCQGHNTCIRSSGHDSIVVWNPWNEAAAALPDMDAGSYRQMLCVETAVTQGLTLAPGARHQLQQIIL